MKKIIVLMMLSFVLPGCASMNTREMENLKIGMTKSQVKQLAGKPLMTNYAYVMHGSKKVRLDIGVWDYRNFYDQKTTLLFFCRDELMQIEKANPRDYVWPPVKFPCPSENGTLDAVEKTFPEEYHRAIKLSSARFLREGDKPGDWSVSVEPKNDSQLYINFSHISGTKRVKELEKQGQYFLGNPSGRDGQCKYDLKNDQIIECGIWQ